MEPTTEQMQELKAIELDMLRAFIDVCKKLGLRYYLLCGTLLGAVRHQGFIPWDDDIDVGMLRADYEVFLEKGQELLPEHLFIQSIKSEREYLMPFAKLRNSETTFLESSVSHIQINHGIFIDIFPLDYYPEQRCAQRKIDREIRHLNNRIAKKFKAAGKPPFIIRLKYILLQLRYPSVKRAVQIREKRICSVAESRLIANFGSAWGKKEIVPVEWYGEGTEMTFEGLKVKVPVQYKNWLNQVYGDYMQLPPMEKRVAHHHTDLIDTKKSFTEYIRVKG